MEMFADQNFSNFVFDWHVREGKQAKLLSQNYSGSRNNQLGQYLKSHSELSWMHEIESQKYSDAAATLKTLAHNEINKVRNSVKFSVEIQCVEIHIVEIHGVDIHCGHSHWGNSQCGNYIIFLSCRFCVKSIFRAPKIAVLELLDSQKLISRKIWVTENPEIYTL